MRLELTAGIVRFRLAIQSSVTEIAYFVVLPPRSALPCLMQELLRKGALSVS
jgi:hypothetical protein